MGTATKHSLGRERSWNARFQSAYATGVFPTTTVPGAMHTTKAAIQKTTESNMRKFAKAQSRSISSRVPGKVKATWNMEKELILPGVLATVPDDHRFLINAIGKGIVYRTIRIDSIGTSLPVTVTLSKTDKTDTTTTNLLTGNTSGADFVVLTSLAATATSLAAAIDALTGWNATANSPTSGTVYYWPDEQYLNSNAPTISIGAFAVSAGLKVVYGPSSTQGIHSMLSVVDWKTTMMKLATGCVCQKFGLKGQGGDAPTLSFDGFARELYGTGVDAVQSVGSSTTLDIARPKLFNPTYSWIKFISSAGVERTNSGSGYQITGISGSTITTSPAHGASVGDTIWPFVPFGAPAEDYIVPGVQGTFTLDSSSTDILSYGLEHNNGMKAFDDLALTPYVSDYTEGFREVMLDLKIRGEQSQIRHLIEYYKDPTTEKVLSLVLGTTALQTLTLDASYAECYEATEVVNNEVIDADLKFQLKSSSPTASDEYTLTIQ